MNRQTFASKRRACRCATPNLAQVIFDIGHWCVRRVFVLAFCLTQHFMLAQAQPATADFFVSPQGNDHWSGTRPDPNADRTDGPFSGLARARDARAKLQRKWRQGPTGDGVAFAAGYTG